MAVLIFLIMAGGTLGDAKPQQDAVAYLPDRACVVLHEGGKPFCVKNPH